jgi:hypothetical protein
VPGGLGAHRRRGDRWRRPGRGTGPSSAVFLRLGLGVSAASVEVVGTAGDYVPLPQQRHTHQHLGSDRKIGPSAPGRPRRRDYLR